MKKSELKSIIRECIEELSIDEGGGTRARKKARREKLGFKYVNQSIDVLDPKYERLSGIKNIRDRKELRDKYPGPHWAWSDAKEMGGPKGSNAFRNGRNRAEDHGQPGMKWSEGPRKLPKDKK